MQIYTPDELLEEPEDSSEVGFLPVLGHDGIIMRGAANLVSAPPKLGKTELLVQVAAEWTSTLYVSEEPPVIWRKRRRSYQEAERPFLNGRVATARGSHPTEMATRIRNAEEEVVVIDTSLLFAIEDTDKASEVRDGLDRFVKACQEHEKTLIIAHHQRKSGGAHGTAVAGSFAFTAAVDVVIEIQRVQGSRTGRIIESNGRAMENMVLRYEQQADGLLVPLANNQVSMGETVETLIRSILTMAGESGSTQQQLELAFAGVMERPPSGEYVRRILRSMVLAGKLSCEPNLDVNPTAAGRTWWLTDLRPAA